MDPFSPEFRRLLKEAHPGLRDADIDRFQELTARRLMVPQEEVSYERFGDQASFARAIDQQISELKQTMMPHFDRVAREYAAMRYAGSSVLEAPKVTIRPKR